MVNERRSLDILRDAKKRNVPWLDMVQALRTLEAAAVHDRQGRAWVKVAAELSAYSVNQLRQMQRTLETLEQLKSRNGNLNLQPVLNVLPLSHVEMLARIAKVDERAAIDAIGSYFGDGRPPTYRQLRERYYELRSHVKQPSPIAVGQQASRAFEAICSDLLGKCDARILYGVERGVRRKVMRWPAGFRYASPDIVIGTRGQSGKLQIDAVDCYAIYGDVSQDETARRVSRVATECTFFRNFWIMLPTWSVGWLVASMCQDLRLMNVGIVDVDPQTRKTSVVVAPSGAAPVPDRRALIPDTVTKHFDKMN